ncbi:hypothetical protein ACQPZX_37460 [Actinoplanes sp. CA-142083]|uniref:hypothetical protein n=1 Tax=Actinoplanes sp. CA-142083 TaxID=3239903 RepID=UPI003D8F6D43
MGLAGLAGVAATGVVVARSERKRRAYTPDEVRDRLHQRVAEAASPAEHGFSAPSGGPGVGGGMASDDISVAE